MILGSQVLDYLWKSLWVSTLAATFVLLGAYALTAFFRKGAIAQRKAIFDSQLMVCSLAFAGTFLIVCAFDPELAVSCFEKFASQAASITLTRSLACGWFFITTLLLLRDSFLIWRQSQSIGRLPLLETTTFASMVKEVSSTFGLDRAPELRVTSENASPYVSGFFKQTLIIPSQLLENLSSEEWRLIIAHEVAHLKNKDCGWNLLMVLLKRVLFFHPLVYFFDLQRSACTEKAADRLALNQTQVGAATYAKTLLKVISSSQALRAGPLAQPAARNFRLLKDRIESMSLHHQEGIRLSKPIQLFLAVATFLLGVSMAQALSHEVSSPSSEAQMCSQLRQEKVIESWLQWKTEVQRCEMK